MSVVNTVREMFQQHPALKKKSFTSFIATGNAETHKCPADSLLSEVELVSRDKTIVGRGLNRCLLVALDLGKPSNQ